MNPETNAPNPSRPSNNGFFKSPAHLLLLVIVLTGLIVAAILIFNRNDSKSNQPTTNNQTESGPSLSFSPANQSVKTGETLTLAIWEDSGDVEINAVQAKISYPTDKFEFVGISTTNSAFEVEAQSSDTDGEIVIARGHVGKLTGRQLVVTIELKAKEIAGAANISFAEGTHLLNATDNQDVLSSKQTGVYTVESQ